MASTSLDWGLLSSYAGLLSLATFSIYVGSYSALPSQKSSENDTQDEEDSPDDFEERLSMEEAYLFPVIGSVVLLGLYLVMKYLGTTWINWLLGWYFSIAGVGSVWQVCIHTLTFSSLRYHNPQTLASRAVTRGISLLILFTQTNIKPSLQSSRSLLRYMYGSAWKNFDKVTVIANKGPRALVNVSFRTPSLFLIPIAVAPSAAYHLWAAGRRSIMVTDILGLSFTHNALSFLKLDSFKTGSILLSGLFLYDIFWVFKTEVMVKVATTLDLPIKLLWPKSVSLSSERGFTLLGLGDIVIPGTFVALALRYDYFRHSTKVSQMAAVKKGGKGQPRPTRESFSQASKPYFVSSLMGYVLGLTTTMAVMHVFGKAQPALLYLSPVCILSFVVTATVRGELAEAWSWSDLPLEENEAEEEGELQLEAKLEGKPLSSRAEEASSQGHDDIVQAANTTMTRRPNRKRGGRP